MKQADGSAIYDPGVSHVMSTLEAQGRRPLADQTVAEARDSYRTSCKLNGLQPVPVQTVTDLVAQRGDSAIPLRVYRPQASPDSGAPALVYFHGGGWVIGDLDTHDPICRYLANASKCCIVAVDYRLAPEHPYPAALDDALHAYRWITANAAELGLDPQALGVAGDSAGGGLATLVALETREAPFPKPKSQILFYPVTDLSSESAGYARVTDGFPVVASSMRWFRNHYLPLPQDRQSERASPLKASSLQGLPPTLIVTARHDPLYEEGVAYAHQLEAAGTCVTHLSLGGQIHGFLTLGGLLEAASATLDLAGRTAAMLLPSAGTGLNPSFLHQER